MRKLHLQFQDLQVESFEVVAGGIGRGTVAGHDNSDPYPCATGYTSGCEGQCYSAGGAGITCGCQSYEGCTQDPNAMECYSDWHGTRCGHTCQSCPGPSVTCATCEVHC